MPAGIATLLEFGTPGIFRVLPPLTLVKQFREILANYGNRQGFSRALAARNSSADSAGLELVVSKSRPQRGPGAVDYSDLKRHERTRIGEQVLRLYFHQFFVGDATLLDIRRRRFSLGDALLWCPTRLWISWDRDFRSAITKIYSGFMLKDKASLQEGLQALDLDVAEKLCQRCFAPERPNAAQFDSSAFQRGFAELLSYCQAVGVRLHRNFLPFSFYLASLVETLDALSGTYNVRRAFEQTLDSNALHPAAALLAT